jgi:type IX secretion system PorP/SprF family membrane protein
MISSKVQAQDIHFSQFNMTPLLQNPALCGVNYDLQAILNYKNQWNSVTSPYKTYNLSFDMKLNTKKATKGFFAAGIDLFSDKSGDSKMGTNQGMLSLAYHILLNDKTTLGGGIMGAVVQRTINYSQLQWMSQYDGQSYNPTFATGEPTAAKSMMYTNFGAGIVWSYKKGDEFISSNELVKANIGVSVFQPHQPAYSFYDTDENLYRKFVSHGNLLYGLNTTNFCIVPGYTFSAQGKSIEFIVGSAFRYITKENALYSPYVKNSAISLGIYYRNQDAFIPTFLIEMGQYALGLSYDINVSKLKSASSGRGGFELSLRYVNRNPFLYKSTPRI